MAFPQEAEHPKRRQKTRSMTNPDPSNRQLTAMMRKTQEAILRSRELVKRTEELLRKSSEALVAARGTNCSSVRANRILRKHGNEPLSVLIRSASSRRSLILRSRARRSCGSAATSLRCCATSASSLRIASTDWFFLKCSGPAECRCEERAISWSLFFWLGQRTVWDQME